MDPRGQAANVPAMGENHGGTSSLQSAYGSSHHGHEVPRMCGGHQMILPFEGVNDHVDHPQMTYREMGNAESRNELSTAVLVKFKLTKEKNARGVDT
ncbi:hypothetical protein R1flu_010428 [Riccia fluitans]|uniref:Uncharacterized protein n=1 Tax=Riccia fluitans TaxID=41844 RepID=A0ABD1Z5A1_9MARC